MILANRFLFMPTDNIKPWMIWGYYISPMMYGQNAIVINEFLDERWSQVRFPFCHSYFSLIAYVTYLRPNTNIIFL